MRLRFMIAVAGFAAGLTTAPAVHAAALGYGAFLGEFSGNVNSAGDLNTALGNILAYQQIGMWEGGTSTGDFSFTMTAFKDGTEPVGGTWEYLDSALSGMLLTVKPGLR